MGAKDILQFHKSGRAIGIGMMPRDTDEGLCVPQHFRGPSFAPFKNDTEKPSSRIQLESEMTRVNSAFTSWRNLLFGDFSNGYSVPATNGHYENKLNVYDSKKAYGGPFSSYSGGSGYGSANKPDSGMYNTGEFIYKGKLLPYTSISGFTDNSLIPTELHTQRYGNTWNTQKVNMQNTNRSEWHSIKMGNMWFNQMKVYKNITASQMSGTWTTVADTNITFGPGEGEIAFVAMQSVDGTVTMSEAYVTASGIKFRTPSTKVTANYEITITLISPTCKATGTTET